MKRFTRAAFSTSGKCASKASAGMRSAHQAVFATAQTVPPRLIYRPLPRVIGVLRLRLRLTFLQGKFHHLTLRRHARLMRRRPPRAAGLRLRAQRWNLSRRDVQELPADGAGARDSCPALKARAAHCPTGWTGWVSSTLGRRARGGPHRCRDACRPFAGGAAETGAVQAEIGRAGTACVRQRTVNRAIHPPLISHAIAVC